MKTCPACHKTYSDDTLNFCLDDGAILQAAAGTSEVATAVLPRATVAGEAFVTDRGGAAVTEQLPPGSGFGVQPPTRQRSKLPWIIGIAAVLGLVLLIAAGGIGVLFYMSFRDSSPVIDRSSDTQTDQKPEKDVQDTDSSTADTERNTSAKAGSVTMSNYRRLKDGINYDEAKAVLGEGSLEPGFGDLGDAGIDMKMYRWDGDNFSFIMLTFMGGKLSGRSQNGLSENIKTALTEAAFHRLKEGMSYEETVRILGAEGSETNYTKVLGTSVATYEWKAGESSSINVTFLDNKAQSLSQYGLK